MGRALIFQGAGQPFEIVRYREPEPRGAEVLVRVTCCTLCRSDLHTHAGRRVEPTPLVLGHEIIGRIEAFGPSASRCDARGQAASVGARVTWSVTVGCGDCFFCRENLPQKCERLYKYGHKRREVDRPLGGGLADHIVLVPGTFWLLVPDEIADRVAAPANCATATAAAMLRSSDAWRVASGEKKTTRRTVLVLGAGVLGVTACALARSSGVETVIACDVSPAAVDRARSFGATHGVLADQATEGVQEATQGRGADVVLELAGTSASVAMALRLVRIGGVVVLAGTVTPTAAVAFDPEMVVRRMLTIRGVHNYAPGDLEAALAFLAGPGRLLPFASLVGDVFPLEEAERAFACAHANPGVRVAVIP